MALAFLLTGGGVTSITAGAVISGVFGMMCIQFVTQFTRVKLIRQLVLHISFFGIVLLTHIQRTGGGNQAGLDKFFWASSFFSPY